jgi:hypothetical protein
MAPERRKQLVLAALVGALALVLAYRLWPAASPPSSRAASARGQARAAAGHGPAAAPDVRIEALYAGRPRPGDVERNLFRFEEAAPPPRSPVAPQPPRPAPELPRPGPPAPPGAPPIPLKFVGFLQLPDTGEKIASLSDGRGVVLGHEGETVLGRYKIWRIGEDSIELSYLDGTGRTTIRLSGQ